MAPSRPSPPLARPSSLTQTTLNGSFIQSSSRATPMSDRQVSKTPRAKTKSAGRTSSNRIYTDVLLSIKPEHLANIVSRRKNHEYRKYKLADGVSRLWFYETSDGGKGRGSITHIAVIPSSVRHTPGFVPTEPFGIGNEEFNAGLKESKYGYPISELYELVHPVTLSEMKSCWKMGGAPMGWQYVGRDLWEDRWGENQDRSAKVKETFKADDHTAKGEHLS